MPCPCSITENRSEPVSGQRVYEATFDMSAIGSSAKVFIPTEMFDCISIHVAPLSHANFNGGVLSVKKTNDRNLASVSVGAGVTITAEGITDVSADDWIGSKFLTLEVTTASSTSGTRARAVIVLKKLGYLRT